MPLWITVIKNPYFFILHKKKKKKRLDINKLVYFSVFLQNYVQRYIAKIYIIHRHGDCIPETSCFLSPFRCTLVFFKKKNKK